MTDQHTLDWQDRAEAAGYPRDDVRFRDGWRCTATIQPRPFEKAGKVWWMPPEPRRCAVMGSEMTVVNGQTLCPRCAKKRAGR